MNLTHLIKKMKPSQRQKLQCLMERKQIVESCLEPHKMKIGAVIQSPTGEVSFTKTIMGWKTNMNLSLEQIVTKLVRPEVAQVVADDLRKTRLGERYTLLPTSLRAAGIGNEGDKLMFERTKRGFVDPTFVTDDQMKSIVESFTRTIKR